jgi:hypothetical protein
MTPIQPYNPQQWVASPAVAPERAQYISTDIAGGSEHQRRRSL